MKIGVCAKVSPHADARIRVESDGSGVDASGEKTKVGDYDEYAVEEAIRTKEAHGGEVVVFTVGDKSADKAIRAGALALGGDKSVLITEEPNDTLHTAKLLAAAIEKESPDVVFTGKTSLDDNNAQVGGMLAELLGWVHVTQAVEFEIDGDSFTATRMMDAGTKQKVTGSLPAVITCEDGLNTVRYPKLPAIMKAKRKPMDTLGADDLGVTDEGGRASLSGFAPPPERPEGKIIEGDAETAAKELVRLLREEAKVL